MPYQIWSLGEVNLQHLDHDYKVINVFNFETKMFTPTHNSTNATRVNSSALLRQGGSSMKESAAYPVPFSQFVLNEHLVTWHGKMWGSTGWIFVDQG